MYYVGGKLLNGIKSMYVDSSACIRIIDGESKWFMIDSWVRQWSIMFPLVVQCIYGLRDEGGEDGDGKERSENLLRRSSSPGEIE